MIKNIYRIISIVILLKIAYEYGYLLTDYFYTKTFSGCRPTFYHPFWDYARAILGSVVAILLLFILKLHINLKHIFIALNLWLILKAFLHTSATGILDIFHFYLLFGEYGTKEMLLFNANILCGVYLLSHSKFYGKKD